MSRAIATPLVLREFTSIRVADPDDSSSALNPGIPILAPRLRLVACMSCLFLVLRRSGVRVQGLDSGNCRLEGHTFPWFPHDSLESTIGIGRNGVLGLRVGSINCRAIVLGLSFLYELSRID